MRAALAVLGVVAVVAAAARAAAGAGADSSSDGSGAALGYLIASKEIETDFFVTGRNLTVKYTFHNIGDGCALTRARVCVRVCLCVTGEAGPSADRAAHDVRLTDTVFTNENFTLIEGSFDVEVDEVAPYVAGVLGRARREKGGGPRAEAMNALLRWK
jgi:hypothetical protein